MTDSHREQLAAFMIRNSFVTGHGDTFEDLLRELEVQVNARTQKSTPGPWVCFYKQKYDEWHVSLPVSGGSMKLALCPDGIQSENREADAHLIAAAPDMLAALIAQEAADEANEVRLNYTEWQALEDKAKALRIAAISKAEGPRS